LTDSTTENQDRETTKMPQVSHWFDNVFARLGEPEQQAVLRNASLSDDRPPQMRGGHWYDPDIVGKWIAPVRKDLVPALLRVVNLTDAEISHMLADGDLSVGTPLLTATQIVMRLTDTGPAEGKAGILITDLAAASAMLLEMTVVIGQANRAFGQEITPPEVLSVSSGSVEFAIRGSLLASGLGLIVFCSAGLAPIAGGVLATAGLFDLVVNWRKKMAETRREDAAARKLEAETGEVRRRADAEIRRLDAETRKLNLEADKLEAETSRGYATADEERFAESSLVPRNVVQEQAKDLGLEEGYANHLLNRSLPSYRAVRGYFRDMEFKSTSASHKPVVRRQKGR
jgi:hypothetical protein